MQFPIKIFYWVTYQQSAHTSHFSHLLIILLFNIYCYTLYIITYCFLLCLIQSYSAYKGHVYHTCNTIYHTYSPSMQKVVPHSSVQAYITIPVP